MTCFEYDAVVIGTGAAGFNAACRIKQGGLSVAIVTEGVNCGTSRNTGSDKQTYYKLGLSGNAPDSIRKMADNLFAGGSVDGDNALCEAALSVRCFMNLCELGVKFPQNRYGEYVGYKTDHDLYARATSAGPLTSKYMTEALEKNANNLGIKIHNSLLAVEILKFENKVCGVLCVDTKSGDKVAFRSANIVIATGGPAGIYADSVYPKCHTGSTGLALSAGCAAQNLTEWQYGLASVSPRWNVSGTYMQVLPRFVSVDEHGVEHEFLNDYFSDIYEALSMVFLKGYQWPFDSKKVLSGSSVIDLLVYRETVLKKRKVYLDFTKNPFGLADIDYDKLSDEACDYLRKAGACLGSPIERLNIMNKPAVELYADKGVDISREYLEVAVCAQHNNGGISVDCWWQTTVTGLFAVGECAGTHGVSRPGGSALNAGQVGSLRAAQYICSKPATKTDEECFNNVLQIALKTHSDIESSVSGKLNNADDYIKEAARRMSDNAAFIRDPEKMRAALKNTRDMLHNIKSVVGVGNTANIYKFYKLKDILITQIAVLTAMIDYADTVGVTRGSSLYSDKNGEIRDGLDEVFRFKPNGDDCRESIQQVCLFDGMFKADWRNVRPVPCDEDFFEVVWRGYIENGNIY